MAFAKLKKTTGGNSGRVHLFLRRNANVQTRLHFGGIAMISASATNCAAISWGSSTNRQRDQKEVDGSNIEPALVQLQVKWGTRFRFGGCASNWRSRLATVKRERFNQYA